MKKKIISLFLIFSMMFTGVSFPVFSDSLTADIDADAIISEETDNSELFSEENTVNGENTEEEPTESIEPTEQPEHTEEPINLSEEEPAPTGTEQKDLSAGNVIIDTDGTYEISNVTSTANTITVKKGVKAALTINNVNITASAAAPITVESGAELTLNVEGENTLTSTKSGSAGIAVIGMSNTDFAMLKIEGSGKLTVTGAANAAGIGANRYNKTTSPINGKIVINGAAVTATGGNNAAGIGSGNYCGAGCDIEINGGYVTAQGGKNAAGIGGCSGEQNGNITINGGYVKAVHGTGTNFTWDIGPGRSASKSGALIVKGGSVDAGFIESPVDNEQMGKSLTRKLILSMPSDITANKAAVTINDTAAYTDENGKLYLYAADSLTTVSVLYGDKTYTVSINAADTEYILEEDTSGGCICTPENSSITLKADDIISVARIDGEKRIQLETKFNNNENCLYSGHFLSTSYELKDEEGNPLSESIAKIESDFLIAYYPEEQTNIRLAVTAVLKGKGTYTAEKTITITPDSTTTFHLENGKIEIFDGENGNLMVRQGSQSYTVPADTDINIDQGTVKTTNTISSQAQNACIVLKNVNIETIMEHPITIGDSCNLKIKLEGTNNLTSRNSHAVNGIQSSSVLTIEGDGVLNSTSGVGAGLGGVKTLTINSGEINARSLSGGAGIGGGLDSGGIDVIVNGGVVKAYGAAGAAGIGGGASESEGVGGNFTINGGTVFAESGGDAYGIGSGGNKNYPGTVNYNGGNLHASMNMEKARPNNGKPQYLTEVSLEGVSGVHEITYTIGEDDTQTITATTDDEGKIYMYLNTGRQWIRVQYNGETYYRYIRIVSDDNNKAICVKNPQTRINTFEISGQIESHVDNDAKTVEIVVPYNLDLSYVTPKVDAEAAETNPIEGAAMNFENESHSLKYTLIGDDFKQKEYTVHLTVSDPPSEPTADTFDISKGSVIISDSMVEYGGTRYKPNPLGYIITGNTNTNTVSLQYAESGKLPPVTFDRLNISLLSEYAIPFTVSAGADITVLGNCSITSVSQPALVLENPYGASEVNLTFTGSGLMEMQGGEQKSTINLASSDSKVTMAGINTRIKNSDGKALEGSGKFYTDSQTSIRVDCGENAELHPQNAEGETLYQITAHIDALDKSKTTAEYNGTTYYVGTDATLYCMVPNGEYNMGVLYDVVSPYEGKVTINGKGEELTLYAVRLESLSYFIDGEECTDNVYLESSGGTVLFKAEGKLVDDVVKIKLKKHSAGEDDDNEVKDIEQYVRKDGDGNFTATVTIPENPYGKYDIIYDIFYEFQGNETKMPYMIGVYRNTSLCKIEKFTIPNQVGNATIIDYEDRDSIVQIYMPYDHEYQTRYTPSAIGFAGGTVSPQAGVPTVFTQYNDYLYARYTVSSRDGETKKVYSVRLYKQPEPIIRNLALSSNTLTCDGGDVTVTASGIRLENTENAEQENNRKVYIYSDDGIAPVEATKHVDGNTVTYTATLHFDENTSNTENKKYILKAKIGDTVQNEINTNTTVVTVNRRAKSLTGITSFTLPNQIGQTEFSGSDINITMPYDADITALYPNIVLEDYNASVSSMGEQDFTNAVTYTVTAEDGINAAQYTVHVTKQAVPSATSLEFTNPRYSSAGRVLVKINGNNLDSAANAVNTSPYIVLDAEMKSGTGTITDSDGTPTGNENTSVNSARAVKNEAGDYIATILVPSNNTSEDRTYELSVTIGDTKQTLTGNVLLTVPHKEPNSKELTDIVLAEGQSELIESPGVGYSLYVPYNIDLRSITPQVYHTGASYSPQGAQNFMQPVTYTITAQDGTTKDYIITAYRSGTPSLSETIIHNPLTYKDTDNVLVELSGQFIPYLTDGEVKDTLKVWAADRDDSSKTYDGTIDYEGNYGGYAKVRFNLPKNESFVSRKVYDVKVTINNNEQYVSDSIIIPRRQRADIYEFKVNGQTNNPSIITDGENGSSITFYMPYATDLTNLLPQVGFDGDSYTPTTAQDFDKKTVNYTVSANGDESRTYTVQAVRDGLPSITSTSVTNLPESYYEKTVSVDVDGVFFYNMKANAVCGDEVIEGRVTMDAWHKAKAEFDIPSNMSYTDDKTYIVQFYLDDFEDPISYINPVEIKVPRRKTREIKSITLNSEKQKGEARITSTDIYITVEYDADITALNPEITIDGDSYTPTGAQNFSNLTRTRVYTVSAADDEDRSYNVHIVRDGHPTLSKLTVSKPTRFNDTKVSLDLQGVFYDGAKIIAEPVGGGTSIEADIKSFEEGKASAELNLPVNYNTESEQKYTLQVILDGEVTAPPEPVEIVLPRRTTREITGFTLPDIQEGDTRIEGNGIYIDVPYHLDIKSVTPEITYDADIITPQGAQDFSDLANPVKYKLSSAGDEGKEYTVYITRIGNDPFLKSIIVERQVGETKYEGDNISLVMKSGSNLKEVEPVLDFDGADYSPRGPQDFTKSKTEPLAYTIRNKYDIEHTYFITITKRSSGGSNESKATPAPTIEPTAEPTEKPQDEVKATPTAQPEYVEPYISGYEENGLKLFRPDNNITRAEVATIMSILEEDFDENKKYSSSFNDVSDSAWYANYINFAVSKGFISGYGDGTCRPENMITRAEFASLAARYIGAEPVSKNKFTDIDRFDWCRGEINALAQMGIINGYEDGLFKPDNKITRAETVAIINRILGRKMTEEIASRLTCPFSDVPQTHWAFNEILLASCRY